MELQPGEGVGLLRLGQSGDAIFTGSSVICETKISIVIIGMSLWDTINLLRSTSARTLGQLTQSAITWSSEVGLH